MNVTTTGSRKCWHCGTELTDRNSWMPTNGFENGGPTFYCVSCQNAFFMDLAKEVGSDLAYFFCCVKFDVPYMVKPLKSSYKYSSERGPWGGYITALRAARWHQRDDRWAGFKDGITNIKQAVKELQDLGAESPEEELERKEQDLADNIEFWGAGPGGQKKYTEADFVLLNRVWNAMTEGRSGLSEQSKMAIQTIAKWTLERDKLMAAKEFDDAKKIDAMIEKLKESEQLRKKDELPQDRARLDDIVQAVERAGLKLYDYEELKKQLATYMFHTPYGYTRDAADQMLLLIRNCTAFNEGVAEVDRLEKEYAIVDNLGEFAPEADDRERETYKELGMTPLHMGGGKNASRKTGV